MNNERKGKLIIFEGIDGCGKSTQLEQVSKILNEKGIDHVFHRELQNPIGRLITDEYLSSKSKTNSYSIGMLYEAQRLHYLQEEGGILQLLNEGNIIIQDRYYYSTIAYLMHKIKRDELLRITKISRELARPDLTVFIDTDPETAINRVQDRLNKKLTIFETLEQLKQFQFNYRDIFTYLQEIENEHIFYIDGNQPVDEISNKIVKKILDHDNPY
jgi:dTMP kinase